MTVSSTGWDAFSSTELFLLIVAAITLTMRQRKGLKKQDVSRQVAVRRRDRVRLVKIPAEKRT